MTIGIAIVFTSVLAHGLSVRAQTSESPRAPIDLWESQRNNIPSAPRPAEARDPKMEDFCDACNRGDLGRVRSLAREGVNVNGHCQWAVIGMTPLTCAAQRGHYDVVQWLLENGADVKMKDKNGHTPIFAAVRCPTGYGRPEFCVRIMELLLKSGADPNVADLLGDTPLMEARKEGRMDKVRLLIQHGATK